MDRLRTSALPEEQLSEGRDEVIRLQGRIRSIISQIREIEAYSDSRSSDGDAS